MENLILSPLYLQLQPNQNSLWFHTKTPPGLSDLILISALPNKRLILISAWVLIRGNACKVIKYGEGKTFVYQ